MNLFTIRPGWDPFAELQRQMDKLFDFTHDVGRQFTQTWKPFPAFNLYESAGEYTLIAPIAGVQPEDIEVTVAGSTLTLKGERKRPSPVPDEFYRRQERWLGKWSRNVQLPEKADTGQLAATMENGLLIVKIPKLPESQPRQVPVRVGTTNNNGLNN